MATVSKHKNKEHVYCELLGEFLDPELILGSFMIDRKLTYITPHKLNHPEKYPGIATFIDFTINVANDRKVGAQV